ncbi:replication-associated recombination protein A [Pendulispora albinea]|uniref:Replication-associated recombination protein A n=1 Tax=Pendulispora albinea TaxID=2741071 RepID=A0ABZ2LZ40_9BACT
MASRARGSGSSMGTGGETLFGAAARKDPATSGYVPLAERMRPHTLEELVGQAHLFGPNKLLSRAIAGDRLPSMILWGPPGVGKTTLGRIVAERTKAVFVLFSAVLGSLPELRQIVAEAKERLDYHGKRTIVFVDEIHRFNKAQQDAFLPHVEAGTITIIGATTENPSFAVNAALLSRCKVFRLEPLGENELTLLLQRALSDETRGLGKLRLRATADALTAIARLSRGDARRALTTLETTAEYLTTTATGESEDGRELTAEAVTAGQSHDPLLYDKSGEEHYNVVSAFIKSMRGSDPDAAVYWMMRMLEAGDDPLFILRRMIIFASEDVGNADPRAMLIVQAADSAFRRIGMPEGLYPLTHAATYLAATAKSNSIGKAWQRARALIEQHGALPVPKKLRNAVTSLMKKEGYGEGYKYAHDFDEGVVPGETYLPDQLAGEILYEPSAHGEEARIRTRLETLRAARDKRDDEEKE